MSPVKLAATAIAAAGLAFAGFAAAQVQRTFVASYGTDANAASNCGFMNPCRSFTAAQVVTISGGEIVALDAAGYGAVTITKSISIVANPGFYAGITASAGNAVTIAATGVDVLLRGLNINGTGGNFGVEITSSSSGVTIENCVISGFATTNTAGVHLNSPTTLVRVSNTVLRGNFDGVWVQNGNLDVVGSKAFGNGRAGYIAFANTTGQAAYLVVSDSVSSQNSFGVSAVTTDPGTTAVATVSHTATTTNQVGIFTLQDASSTALASVAYSNVSNNVTGLQQGSGTLESMGNNIVRNNTTNTNGTITPAALQ